MIAPMTERGLPTVDDAVACPFVAFEKDREGRSTSADRRHRCYAEPVPASRAAAHQEAYCLSSSFPVCPTFQDWARREAAQATKTGGRAPAAAPAMSTASTAPPRPEAANWAGDESALDEADAFAIDAGDEIDDGHDHDPDEPRHQGLDDERPIIRNPPRDWAAPPPWAAGGSASVGRRADGRAPTDGSRGLAGSAADRLATHAGVSAPDPHGRAPGRQAERGVPPDDELAGLVTRPRVGERSTGAGLPPGRSGHRPSVSSSRVQRTRRVPERDEIVGPSWERSRRFEAYPTIRARVGLPTPPRLAVLGAALVIAAVGLFFLPALLGVGGDGGPGGGASSTPSAGASGGAPTPTPRPTPTPAPTPQVYVIQTGDTLFGVAAQVGLTLEELLAANPQITDPDKIAVGDEIFIPPKPPDEFTDPLASSPVDPSAGAPSASP